MNCRRAIDFVAPEYLTTTCVSTGSYTFKHLPTEEKWESKESTTSPTVGLNVECELKLTLSNRRASKNVCLSFLSYVK